MVWTQAIKVIRTADVKRDNGGEGGRGSRGKLGHAPGRFKRPMTRRAQVLARLRSGERQLMSAALFLSVAGAGQG